MGVSAHCEKCDDTGLIPVQGWAWREGDPKFYPCDCPAGQAREARKVEPPPTQGGVEPIPTITIKLCSECGEPGCPGEGESLVDVRVIREDDLRDHLRGAVCHSSTPTGGASTTPANEVERLQAALTQASVRFTQVYRDRRESDKVLATCATAAAEIARALDEDQDG